MNPLFHWQAEAELRARSERSRSGARHSERLRGGQALAEQGDPEADREHREERAEHRDQRQLAVVGRDGVEDRPLHQQQARDRQREAVAPSRTWPRRRPAQTSTIRTSATRASNSAHARPPWAAAGSAVRKTPKATADRRP